MILTVKFLEHKEEETEKEKVDKAKHNGDTVAVREVNNTKDNLKKEEISEEY